MSKAPPPFDKWEDSLDRIEHEQLTGLLLSRDKFAQMNEVVAPYVGGHHGADLYQWMTQNYVAFAATAIRRMMEKPNKGWTSISLRILLEDLAANDSLLTRTRYQDLYRGSGVEFMADRDFNRIVRSDGAAYVPAARIKQDIFDLKQICEPVLGLVNKVIAHTEADPAKVGKTSFEEIDKAVDALEEAFNRYSLLIRGRELASLPYESFDVRDGLRKIWPPK
jgi:hypothetical protein